MSTVHGSSSRLNDVLQSSTYATADSLIDLCDHLHHLLTEGWRSRAACGEVGDAAFPDSTPHDYCRSNRVFITRYCNSCPVTTECGEAGRNEAYGIWGGMTPRQRRLRYGTANVHTS